MNPRPQTQTSSEQIAWFVRILAGKEYVEFPGTIEDALSASKREGITTILVDFLTRQSVNNALAQALRQQSIQLAARALALSRERISAVNMMAEINPIVLKGEALGRHYYENYAMRPMSDMDILVNAADCERAISLLTQTGYRLATTNSGDLVMPQYTLFRKLGNGLVNTIDLHVALFNRPALQNVLRYQELRKHADRFADEGTWLPCPAHLLLHATLHLAAHHSDDQSLIWLYDIYLLRRNLSGENLDRIIDVVKRQRLSSVVLPALAASERCFFVANDVLLPRLITDSRHSPDNYDPVVLDGHSALGKARGDWKALATTTQRAAWLRQHLFPDRRYMRQRYQMARSWSLPLFYLWRIVKGTVKLVSSR